MPEVNVKLREWAMRAQPHWLLLPGLLLGAILRLWRLPGYLYGDEAEYATVARSISENFFALTYPAIEGFGPQPFVSQPPVLLYLDAMAGLLVGSAERGPLLVSALLGTATIAVVYALGCVLRDRWMGGLAAFFLAVLPFHVAVSRSAQLDAGFTFLVALTLLAFLLWLRDPRPRWALATGAAAAATMYAKLPGVLVLLPIVLILALRALPDLRRRHDPLRGPDARARLRRDGLHTLIAGLPVAVATFAYFVNLWVLHATVNFFRKLGWQADRVAGTAPGAIPRDWQWYFTSEVGLWVQWGFGLVFLAIAGAVLVLGDAARRPRTRWLAWAVLLWPLPMLAFLLASSRKEWFYAMPLTPVLVLLAAWAVHAGARRAWIASKPLPGQPWWRTPGAVLAVAGLTAIACYAPFTFTLERKIGGDAYGYGLREAALWIGEEDPEAAQVGTMLGRFSLHFYNGQDTYHYFVNHTWLDQQAEAGTVRYAVRDTYLNLTYERDWLDGFIERHNGTLAKSFDNGHGRSVDVYRLG